MKKTIKNSLMSRRTFFLNNNKKRKKKKQKPKHYRRINRGIITSTDNSVKQSNWELCKTRIIEINWPHSPDGTLLETRRS